MRRGRPPAAGIARKTSVEVSATEEEKDRWTDRANACGVSVAEWMRRAAEAYAEEKDHDPEAT